MAFLDPGKDRTILWSLGPQAPAVTVAEDVRRGDILGYSSGWVKADATTGGVIQGRFVALADALEGAMCPVSHVAIVTGYQVIADGEVVSEATPGDYVYVAEEEANGNGGISHAGEVTQTEPDTVGDANTIIGIALDEATILFFLNSRADSLVEEG